MSEAPVQDSPGIHARATNGVVQIETLGRQGMLVMLVMFVVIVAIAGVASYALGVGEARAENTATQVRMLNAEVKILRSEFDKTQAQLLTQGVIKNPHQ